jgi:hypothetical protein
MSSLSPHCLPLSSRPWFVIAAMSLGVTAMAFGAYTVENPRAFTTRILRATPAPMLANASWTPISPATESRKASPVTLSEVTITARPSRLPHRPIVNDNTCTEGWRSLATGPAERQVRTFCPTPR